MKYIFNHTKQLFLKYNSREIIERMHVYIPIKSSLYICFAFLTIPRYIIDKINFLIEYFASERDINKQRKKKTPQCYETSGKLVPYILPNKL